MRTGYKLVPTKTRLEVTFSLFSSFGRLAESSHSARVPLNGGSLLDHLARLLATNFTSGSTGIPDKIHYGHGRPNGWFTADQCHGYASCSDGSLGPGKCDCWLRIPCPSQAGYSEMTSGWIRGEARKQPIRSSASASPLIPQRAPCHPAAEQAAAIRRPAPRRARRSMRRRGRASA